MRTTTWILAAAALAAAARSADAQSLTRGPYLQQGTSNTLIVRWRTDTATNSRVRYGTAQGSLTQTADDGISTTEHEVKITGLSADTKYYYSVGTSSTTLAGNDAGHFFVTSPNPGTAKPTRIWVIGDAGTNTSSQRAVRDAYYGYTGTRHTDLWLMLGDNAYSDGTDSEYQNAVFGSTNAYPSLLRKSVVWPTLGNHDGHSTSGAGTGPYYGIFTLPRNAEAGGLPSGTEAYYSFDYGNIHFICLDSYQQSRSAGGAMHTWAKNDANATTRDWIIAYWHHPPYSKGSHNSDSDSAMTEMRKNFNPILEDAGVDLVLTGHSHSYERSFLLDGHYGTSDTLTAAMKKDGGSGRDADAYRKSAGTASREGAVYAVAGSSGKTSGGSLDHSAMFISLNQLGSMVIDVDGNRLDARFLRSDGTIGDSFSIVKGTTPPPPPPGDTTPPTVTVSTPTTASTHATSASPITIGGSASDNVGVAQVTWANAATGGTGGAAGTTSWSASIALAAGSNAITVTAKDAAGNQATDTITVTYTPPAGDATPPSIAVTGPTSGPAFDASTEPVAVSGTASDNVAVVTVTWSNAATGDSGTASGTSGWSASVELAAGDNVITVTAFDGSGNSTSATITVTYTPPAGGGGSPGSAARDGEEGLKDGHCSMGSVGLSGTGAPWPWLLLPIVFVLGLRRR